MSDSLGTLALLCLSALAAGVMNALAGGGTLLTFPALLLALPPGEAGPVIANATSTVALVPGSLAGAWGFRREVASVRHWIALLLLPSLIGGVIGSLLVTRLHPRYFAMLVPWLILTATLLFLLQPTITRVFGIGRPHAEPRASARVAVVVFQLFVAIYGGYFGAGIGILMLSSLSLMGLGNIHRMNAAKTIMAACMNGVSVAVFVADGVVEWKYAALMAVSAIVGGYLGAAYGRRLPRGVVRWLVIAIGFGLAAKYFYEQYASSHGG
jgi:uncharacterized membrane protein YfcA